MNNTPTESDVAAAIEAGEFAAVLRGERCMYRTPPEINDDMLPTDHVLLLDEILYPLARAHDAAQFQSKLEQALKDACHDALGVYAAIQCYRLVILDEHHGKSPFRIDREALPPHMARAFLRETPGLHALELHPRDLARDRSYRITQGTMQGLARDHGIDWGIPLP